MIYVKNVETNEHLNLKWIFLVCLNEKEPFFKRLFEKETTYFQEGFFQKW